MAVNEFMIGAWKLMSGHDRLRQAVMGEAEFAARLAPFIQAGLDTIAAQMPNAAIDAALHEEKPEVVAVLDLLYGLTQPKLRANETTTKLGISRERLNSRSAMGLVRLRTRLKA